MADSVILGLNDTETEGVTDGLGDSPVVVDGDPDTESDGEASVPYYSCFH